jgi:hypothetical protein
MDTLLILSALYSVLIMVLVSLDTTYNITHSLMGSSEKQNEYGSGMNFKNKGFILHILIFTLLILAPNLMMCTSSDSPKVS